MQGALRGSDYQDQFLLDRAAVVYDPVEPDKKVEPFYFDARRGSSSRPLDIGFSPDSLQMTSAAYPAVEFLCLVGLQRFRPAPTRVRRVFDYYAWASPLEPSVASVAACGLLDHISARGFRFKSAFRTDQRKHKAFTAATPIERRNDGSAIQ
jgi:CRISPR-associated protein Csb3